MVPLLTISRPLGYWSWSLPFPIGIPVSRPKPRLRSDGYRGAEAPLFHGGSGSVGHSSPLTKATSKAADMSVSSTRSTFLSPLRGLLSCLLSYPWLAPWAAFFRRFAARSTQEIRERPAVKKLPGCARRTGLGGCPYMVRLEAKRTAGPSTPPSLALRLRSE